SSDITLTAPTRTGYTFAGWTGTDLDEATASVTIPAGSIGNRSYTATWTAITYDIAIDLGGGSVATANPTTYTIESSDITLTAPTRTGYTFAGWTGTDLDEATASVTIPAGSIGNRLYTAIWIENVIELASNADNTDIITTVSGDGKQYKVTLAGRTLYKDGKWNTLCLPFDVTLSGSVLEGATARTLTSASFDNGTLTLQFGEPVTVLAAGTPYIIKWDKAEDYDTASEETRDIKNPVFTYATISDEVHNFVSTDEKVQFIGTRARMNFEEEDKSILFMGADNTLYYPQSGAGLGAQRAYFQMTFDAPVKSFVLNYGDGSTDIQSVGHDSRLGEGTGWYTLDGKKLLDEPTTKGIYIHNGRKVLK
ncbi:MAG: InlB B-repeat-containing protein, partial [Bacteroidaceae bacterium]|nr:InlB B-repeat-containing protein [Bacteroidaceae bacterium]